MRLFGLSPDQKSILFKMMHNLLPNKERLCRIRKIASPYCVFCADLQTDDLKHLFECPKYSNIMLPLMDLMKKLIPATTVSQVIGLKLELDCSIELPVIWLLTTSIMLIWNAWNAGKDLAFAGFKAEVQACLAVLKGT